MLMLDATMSRSTGSGDEGFEQRRRAADIGGGVIAELIHALADADLRRQVIDRVNALQGAIDHVAIANIAYHQLDLGIEVLGARCGACGPERRGCRERVRRTLH